MMMSRFPLQSQSPVNAQNAFSHLFQVLVPSFSLRWAMSQLWAMYLLAMVLPSREDWRKNRQLSFLVARFSLVMK